MDYEHTNEKQEKSNALHIITYYNQTKQENKMYFVISNTKTGTERLCTKIQREKNVEPMDYSNMLN